MHNALKGKTLVTIVGGLSIKVLEKTLYGDGSFTKGEKLDHCHIVRVIPNTATAVGKGMTLIIEEDEYPYPTKILGPVYSLFTGVGQVKLWPAAKAPIGATLSASSPAFFTFLLEAVVDAGVEMGVERAEALEMATAGMCGAVGLLTSGESPNEMKRKIATKGGSTEAGFKALEAGNAKEAMVNAVKDCAVATGRLGDRKP
ncbi:delta 1-pyrroline-5-carboxylate reductase [Mycoblastus sanguinarius]|nr:delta 1-pyrroline-5-carboxylate reductase [Mycoblastus sanguinarius]